MNAQFASPHWVVCTALMCFLEITNQDWSLESFLARGSLGIHVWFPDLWGCCGCPADPWHLWCGRRIAGGMGWDFSRNSTWHTWWESKGTPPMPPHPINKALWWGHGGYSNSPFNKALFLGVYERKQFATPKNVSEKTTPQALAAWCWGKKIMEDVFPEQGARQELFFFWWGGYVHVCYSRAIAKWFNP